MCAATTNFPGHSTEGLWHSYKETAPMQSDVRTPKGAASTENREEEETRGSLKSERGERCNERFFTNFPI